MFTVKQLQHPKTHFKTSYQSVKNVNIYSIGICGL